MLWMLSWRDGVEIIFFATVVYIFSAWLKQDQHKNLLGAFYAYCACFFTAHALQLTTVEQLLFFTTPIAIVLFIVFHQFTLQKNFVALRSITQQTQTPANWLETIVQSCLIAVNQNKEVTYIIEHQDSLDDHVITPLALHAAITKELLTLFINGTTNHDHQTIWINTHGIVRGLNAQWHSDFGHLFYTEKMDTIVLTITPQKKLFDLVMHGKLYKQITGSQAIKYIHHDLIKTKQPLPLKKELNVCAPPSPHLEKASHTTPSLK